MTNHDISPFLSDSLVILGAAGIVIPVFARARITPVIGFILVGLLVGPYGLGRHVGGAPWLAWITINNPEGLAPFAEFGIVLLLFSIGLELSFARLWSLRRLVFGLGSAELLVIAAAIGGGLWLADRPPAAAMVLGVALAMSSTALVLRMTSTATPVGRAALAMLLFEDIALVPIIFLIDALAPQAGGGAGLLGLLRTLGLGTLVVAVLLVGGRFGLPLLFAQAARTKNPELLLSASLLVVILAALATAGAGLSPIVGALIAGLVIAETEYHAEVEAITEPFKGLALGVFLITIGMSIDLRVVWDNLGALLSATAAVMVIKAIVTGVLLRLMGARRGTATETGVLMASPSETTLIVLSTATAAQLIAPATAQFWQIVTAIGMTVTPLLALAGRRLGRRFDQSEEVVAAAPGGVEATEEQAPPRVLIVGFGRVGELVADMLVAHARPYAAIDSDADLVAAARRRGYDVTFGDAARGDTLDKLGAADASAVVLSMEHPVLAQRLVRKLRAAYPALPIITRARDTGNAAELYRAGASLAVPATLESSLQLSEAVLVEIGVAAGPAIASIHAKRDELRDQLMHEGELDFRPRLRSSTVRR